ncbi:MAG: metal ABC transporter ATP-binding protein [Actinomycetes bacterium]
MSVTRPGTRPGATPPVLAAEDVSVALGGLPVLRGITLTVRAGEAVALLGGNGSGKSTLIRALLGLVPAERGGISLFGTPQRRFREWKRIGYVPQRAAPGLAQALVSEVVASGRLATRRLFRPLDRADRDAVGDALDVVGMRDLAGEELGRLSGGQQQRVLIARALAGTPDLLVMDEPMSGVDLRQQDLLADVLATSLGHGTAILVVLHELGALHPLIDRAVVLREGRVAYDGALMTLQSGGHHGHHEHESPLPRPAWFEGTLEGSGER